ncbi:MAG: hypothetical protein ACREBE_03875 [bacterium]
MFLSHLLPGRGTEAPPKEWDKWLRTVYPKRVFDKPLGRRHKEFWKWVLGVKRGERPRPFVGIWDRGAGKSTSAEGGAVALGVRGRRKYGLYISGAQEQADKHVASCASLFESDGVQRFYPEHAHPKVGKHGNRRGWRRNRIWTSGDFAIDALGLDVAARGIKLDEQRPDFIVLDDIDGKHDSPLLTAKKIETITHTILPAGSLDVAVLAIQNLILRGGFFTQLVDGTLDVLVDRIISGPFKSIENLKWEWQKHPVSGMKRAVIIGGKATWEGKPVEVCQQQIDTYGINAFLLECQHEVKGKGLGIVLRVQPANRIDLSDDECRELLALNTGFGGIDFQAARFAFGLYAIDKYRRAIRIDEYFSQFEGLKLRAFTIHRMCQFYGVMGMLPIWGDAANPQDIMELNGHFRDGWDVCADCGEQWPGREAAKCGTCHCAKQTHETSKLRVVGVANENKLRKVAVERINDALDRGMVLYRTGIEYQWMLGRTSTEEGTLMTGSRLEWESENWSYPKMRPGEAQDENPDDNTADGADMMAQQRYALMSHWRKAKFPKDFGKYEDDRAHQFNFQKRKFVEPEHAVDLVQNPSRRLSPRVAAPRPRGIR